MFKEAFLVCALSLAPTNFYTSDLNPILIEEIAKIKEFINKTHPGAEIKIVHEELQPDDPHWERLPFTWRGFSIFIKRHHIYDTAMNYSA